MLALPGPGAPRATQASAGVPWTAFQHDIGVLWELCGGWGLYTGYIGESWRAHGEIKWKLLYYDLKAKFKHDFEPSWL